MPLNRLYRISGEVHAADGRRKDPLPNLPNMNALTRAQRQALADQSEALGQISYMPDNTTVGLLPGWDVHNLPNVVTGNVTLNGYHENTLYWGQITPGTFGMQLSNCVLAGPRPSALTSGSALVRCYDANIGLSTITDCVFDPKLWMDASLNPPGGAYTDVYVWALDERNGVGIRGGRVTVRNCLFQNIQDNVHVNMTWNTAGDNDMLDMQHCWFASAAFYKGPLYPDQPEGTHSDLIQFHRGRNITVKFNRLGGPGDRTGYDSTPAYATGYGAKNAAIMLKQEVNNTEAMILRNIEIAYNIIWNPAPYGYGINHYRGNPTNADGSVNTKYNDFVSNNVKIHDNLFVKRADNWDIARLPAIDSCYSGNLQISINPDGKTWKVLGPANKNAGA